MSTRIPSASTTSPKRRAADGAYDAIEALLSTLQLEPESPVVEAELAERTGAGPHPLVNKVLATRPAQYQSVA